MNRTLFINEDNFHFYGSRTAEEMTVEAIQKLVDTYAESDYIGGLLFSTNCQRALFDSQSWEPLYQDYDGNAGADQACLAWLPPEQRKLRLGCHGRHWIHNLWLLRERGIDQFAVWLERCRHHGIEGWLTMRMNDCHHNTVEDAFWHSTLWKERKDLRRADYREEGVFGQAFDYGKPEVVAHHLALLTELTERYDLDGIELDWVRAVHHFRPGHEEAGRNVLTAFMREARRLADAAAERLGHPVKVGVRLPADLTNALSMGYDIPAWGREGLVDMVTLASFFNQPFYDWQVNLWKSILEPEVRLLCQPEHLARAFPQAMYTDSVQDYRFHFGACASALQRGADGIYLFNDCYRESRTDAVSQRMPTLLGTLLHTVADLDKLTDTTRRHPVSFPQITGPGMADGSMLPVPLQLGGWTANYSRPSRVITLRIPVGPKPKHAAITAILGFDAESPDLTQENFTLWLNGEEIPATAPDFDISQWISGLRAESGQPKVIPDLVEQLLAWPIPLPLLQADTNILEILPPDVPGHLVWAEICIGDLHLVGDCSGNWVV